MEEDDTEMRKNDDVGVDSAAPRSLAHKRRRLHPISNNLGDIDLTQILSCLRPPLKQPTKCVNRNQSVIQTLVLKQAWALQLDHQKNKDDDDLLRNITHEFEFEEEKGPTIYVKLQKILEDLILKIFKKG